MVADNWFDVAAALMVLFTMTAAFIYAALSARPGPALTPEDLAKGNGETGDPVEAAADLDEFVNEF